MTQDEKYLTTIRNAIQVCGKYQPKFGQGKNGLTLQKFQELYQADPFYHWFGLDSPKLYAAHKAAGGITSVYRQIGLGMEKVFRQVLQDFLKQTEEESNWSYIIPSTDSNKPRKLKLDGRIALSAVRVASRKRIIRNWLRQASRQIGIDESAVSLHGMVFECRQGYKSKDAKRQNADVANASSAYVNGYLPCVMVFSQQIDSDVADRYVRARWLLLKGTLTGTSFDSTYLFCREIIGFDLESFLARHAGIIREDIARILHALLK